jgi:hypothetical protein
MNPAQNTLLTLKQAADLLSVSVETLLEWNEHNILKPTITSEGEIGYSEKQINEFIIIRTQISKKDDEVEDPAKNTPALPVKTWQAAPEKEPEDVDLAKPEAKALPFEIITLFTGIFLIVAVVAFFQTDRIRVLFDELERSQVKSEEKNIYSQTSKFNLSSKEVYTTPIALRSESNSDKNLRSEAEEVTEHQNSPLGFIFATIRNAVSIPGSRINGNLVKSDVATAAGHIGSVATYASRTVETNDNEDLIFDSKGNIKGEAKDTLAMIVGGIGQTQVAGSLKQVGLDPISQAAILVVGLLAFVFIFPRKFAYLPKIHGSSVDLEGDKNEKLEKVIELLQKTDGSIVLYHDEKEYKISKPELYSESDRFIERLMEVTTSGAKEIEYEVLKDEKIKFSTPLSRLVTRLGFVGVKRDLFFPRTSKDRVMFRKFLTRKDLDDMNLTPEEILSELTPLS